MLQTSYSPCSLSVCALSTSSFFPGKAVPSIFQRRQHGKIRETGSPGTIESQAGDLPNGRYSHELDQDATSGAFKMMEVPVGRCISDGSCASNNA